MNLAAVDLETRCNGWGLGVPNGDYWVSVLSQGPMDWILEDGGWEMLWDLLRAKINHGQRFDLAVLAIDNYQFPLHMGLLSL